MRLKRYEDFFLKILALFFATLLWFFVALQEKVAREIPARIIYKNLPPRTILLRSEPSFVRVKVVGPRSLLRSLPDRPLLIPLDLSHLGPGLHQVKIPLNIIRLPSGLKAQEIHPPRVEIFLDRVVERWMKVTPELKGRPFEGYLVEKVKIRPPSVKVKGARQVLGRLKAISTLPIDLSEKKVSFETTVFLNIPEGVIDIKPNKVWVKVKIRRASP